tara:strand:+ start:2087 stop:3013 length:927 start_codon:yes stop_codon:yes gene_type:complete
MTEELVDIADLDCIFLTYDEPKKEEFWIRIQNMVPWAKRVDGVHGSDAAHKAAAAASDTDRFVLIDGDNLPDPDFFNLQLLLDDHNRDNVFRWKARNEVNGLMYGNGGLSCWTKDFVNNMQTHEHSDGADDTCVEFCFDPKYQAMHDCYSTTYPNGSAYQAWRAGFREGVKMCLDRGAKPDLKEFERKVHQRNYDHLSIWQTVGRDVDNGWWAIYGARVGTYLTMLTDWDYRQVQDFNNLKQLWEDYKHKTDEDNAILGETLQRKLALPITEMSADQSKFFKHHYKQSQKNLGTTMTEMDIIRRQEGW